MTQRPRVFVSSVVDDFSDFREAARRGIIAGGGDPVLVNEDFPSLSTSSRNACLDAIDSCDYVVSIVGARGGWTAPSGKLVVEEEFEHARKRNLVTLAFLQETERDVHADQFAERLSDYVDGNFRATFRTPEDLEQKIARAIGIRVGAFTGTTAVQPDLSGYFSPLDRNSLQYTVLRFTLVPERNEEVVDPVRIASPEFLNDVYRVGHSTDVKLFSFARSKSSSRERAGLVVEQVESNGRFGNEEFVRLTITEAGAIQIDANATGRVKRGGASSIVDTMVVAIEDLEGVLMSDFRFAEGLFNLVDPYRRHERFAFNTGLLGLGYRQLERNPQPRSQIIMSPRQSDSVVAYEQSRVISRSTLREPSSEIERAITLLLRNAGD